MNTLVAGLSYVDLKFQRVPHVIATAVVHGTGLALIDPGPSSTLPGLRNHLERAGLSINDVSALLLTHIHLDHAGASGTLVRENPRIKVYVHEHGAPHMANPEKLLASATRLYGDAMDRLWGEFLPVPANSMIVLKGGEVVEEGGRRFEVAYTPGHASHHVSYFDRDSGIAFVGDTAGVKVVANGYVLPPTPPPDIDLDVWRGSVDRIQQWHPSTLFLTHFGPFSQPSAHLRELVDHLDYVGSLSKTALARQANDDEREEWFVQEIRRELRRLMAEPDVQAYEVAGRFDLSWRGLARYWRKKG
jgi:glyoxylase-like metal-dependent hydrolase (beta-lactamase superfamily II)